jgi:hypothetical protein
MLLMDVELFGDCATVLKREEDTHFASRSEADSARGKEYSSKKACRTWQDI